LPPAREALQHRLHDRVDAEAAGGVEMRSEPDLRVDDAVLREVLDVLVRDALEARGRLQERDRVAEALEVLREAPPRGAGREPVRERLLLAAREIGVPDPVGELEDRPRAEGPVEVLVQRDLRGPADELAIEGAVLRGGRCRRCHRSPSDRRAGYPAWT